MLQELTDAVNRWHIEILSLRANVTYMQAECRYLASHGWDIHQIESLLVNFPEANAQLDLAEETIFECARRYDSLPTPVVHRELLNAIKTMGESFTPMATSIILAMETNHNSPADAPHLLLNLCGTEICRANAALTIQVDRLIDRLIDETSRFLSTEHQDDAQGLPENWGCAKCHQGSGGVNRTGMIGVRMLREGSHEDVSLLQCPSCGQYIVSHWFEIWMDEDDVEFFEQAPVAKSEAATLEWVFQPGVSFSKQDELLGSLIHRKPLKPPDETHLHGAAK
jgi:hypothetical protein